MSSYMCPNQCELLCKNMTSANNFITPNFYDLTDDEIKFCKKDPKDKKMDDYNNNLSIVDFRKTAEKTNPEEALNKFKENIKKHKLKVIKPRYSESGGLP